MSRFLLLRHALPQGGARGCYLGRADPVLSLEGHIMAQQVAVALAARRPNRIVASPLQRARQTADTLAQAAGLRVHTDERLREIDFGDFEGKTFDEARAANPEAVAAWDGGIASFAFPGGESYADCARRVEAFDHDLRASGHAGGLTVIVGHGGPLLILLARWLGWPAERLWSVRLGHACWASVEFRGGPLGQLLELTAPGPIIAMDDKSPDGA